MKRMWWMVWVLGWVACAAPTEQLPVAQDETEWQTPAYAEGFRWRQTLHGLDIQVLDLESEQGGVLMDIHLGEGQVFDRVACLSTTHLNLLQSALALDHVVASAYLSYISDSVMLAHVQDLGMRDLGNTGEANVEVLIDAQTEVFFTYPFGGATHQAVLDANIAVVPVSEYLETHPLGRAEWMRFMGLLTGHNAEADAAFAVIRSAYEQTANSRVEPEESPVVFTGSQDGGQWFAPAGQSLIAQFVSDAGGEYLFADRDTRGNISLDVEVLIQRVTTADHWGLVTYSDASLTRDFLAGQEPLLKDMPFMATPDGVFACNTAEVDYFGTAIVEPHLILQDLQGILGTAAMDTGQATFHYFNPIAP